MRDFSSMRNFLWKAFGVDSGDKPDPLEDIKNHKGEFSSSEETERENIIKSRIGQGKLRDDLITLWGSCSITGLSNYP